MIKQQHERQRYTEQPDSTATNPIEFIIIEGAFTTLPQSPDPLPWMVEVKGKTRARYGEERKGGEKRSKKEKGEGCSVGTRSLTG